ncbi:hypothetical protein VTN00DRAFT_7260 [Thermoascus crustaceus]|uniref:uncharacterized protein n=1 Tax=Thermoascus crustaceus TaxID=5088 RepID=UPI0037441008
MDSDPSSQDQVSESSSTHSHVGSEGYHETSNSSVTTIVEQQSGRVRQESIQHDDNQISQRDLVIDKDGNRSSTYHPSNLEGIGSQFVDHNTLPSYYPSCLDSLRQGKGRFDEQPRRPSAPLVAAWTHSWTAGEVEKVSKSCKRKRDGGIIKDKSEGSPTA